LINQCEEELRGGVGEVSEWDEGQSMVVQILALVKVGKRIFKLPIGTPRGVKQQMRGNLVKNFRRRERQGQKQPLP